MIVKFLLIFFSVVLFLGFWTFFFLRVFLEKNPLDISEYAFFMMSLLIFGTVSKSIILKGIFWYKNSKKGKIKKVSKVSIFIGQRLEEIGFFVEKEIYLKLKANFLFSGFSLFWFRYFCKQRNFLQNFYLPFLIIPWSFWLVIFFFEISQKNLIVFSLYFFSLNLLIKNFFKFLLFLIKLENNYFLMNSLKNNQLEFFIRDGYFLNFFLLNSIIKCNYLLHTKELQNKRAISFLLFEFKQICFFRGNLQIIDQFIIPIVIKWSMSAQKLNIIIFSLVFFKKSSFLDPANHIYPLVFGFLVFLFFVTSISLLVSLLNKDIKDTDWKIFDNLVEFNHFFKIQDDWFNKTLTRRFYLEKKDLINEDLISFFSKLSIKELVNYQKAPFRSCLTEKESNAFLKLNEESYAWFLLNVFKRKIDLKTYEYSGED